MFDHFYSSPPDYENMQRAIEWLKEKYRQLKAFPIGNSVLGREITALSIGNPTSATLFVGAVHGLEWITSLLLIQFCEEVLEGLQTGGSVSDIDVQRALSSRSLVIVPCLNPDGVEIALHGADSAGPHKELVLQSGGKTPPQSCWKANAKGVDLNRNFDAGWAQVRERSLEQGCDGPGPAYFSGPHPNSEPETMAITDFVRAYQPRTLYAFHTQGEEIYWQYGEHTPTRSRMIAQILASSSGYAMARPKGSAAHGGLKDWFIDKYHRPGFTVEVGKGKSPLSQESFPGLYARLQELLILAALL